MGKVGGRDSEDEEIVAPLLIWGDTIAARFEDGTVHQVRVDLTQTKTHPNFSPRSPWKVLRAAAVSSWKHTPIRKPKAIPISLPISTSIKRDSLIALNAARRIIDKKNDLDYRIHEDGTVSGKKLPPLPNNGAYSLAYVDIPLRPKTYARHQARLPSQSLSPLSDRTKVDAASLSPKYSKTSPILYDSHPTPAKAAEKKSRVRKTKAPPKVVKLAPSEYVNPRKRKRDVPHPEEPPSSLVVRISRDKLEATSASRRKKHVSRSSRHPISDEEPPFRWSTEYMYPLTERHHEMYDTDIDPTESPSSRAPPNLRPSSSSSNPSNTSHPTKADALLSLPDGCFNFDLDITRRAILAALAAMQTSVERCPSPKHATATFHQSPHLSTHNTTLPPGTAIVAI